MGLVKLRCSIFWSMCFCRCLDFKGNSPGFIVRWGIGTGREKRSSQRKFRPLGVCNLSTGKGDTQRKDCPVGVCRCSTEAFRFNHGYLTRDCDLYAFGTTSP